MIGIVHGIGDRMTQQDAYWVSEDLGGYLLVLADGMGGRSGGEKASAAVIETCRQFVETQGEIPKNTELLKGVLSDSNTAVREALGRLAGKGGSTAVFASVWEDCACWVSVGDSHLYLWRDGKLKQLNKEHNYAATLALLVEAGTITREDAEKHPSRDSLTSCIGEEEIAEIDESTELLKLQAGDKLMLCSDGVFRTVPDEELTEILCENAEAAAAEIERRVTEAAIPEQDNFTAIIWEKD